LPLSEGLEANGTVQLTDGLLGDSDGDGVPDVVDDCPLIPDVDQKCRAGDMGGQAGVDLRGSSGVDLFGVDLLGADLRGSLNCALPGALFCDGFETGDTSLWNTVVGGGITMTVDTAQPFSGTHSLHIHTTGGSNTYWLQKTFAPITSGTLSLRVYLYSAAAYNAPIYFVFLQRGTGSNDYVAGLDTLSGPVMWTIYDKNGGNADELSASFSAGSWHCLELEVDVSPIDLGAATNVAKLYIDGNANAPITWNLTNVQSTASLAEMDIGVTYQNVAAGVSNDFFIDDVVLATQHIGCQ
jgi:hypothetical protein